MNDNNPQLRAVDEDFSAEQLEAIEKAGNEFADFITMSIDAAKAGKRSDLIDRLGSILDRVSYATAVYSRLVDEFIADELVDDVE